MYIAGAKRSIDTGDTYFEEIAKANISGNRDAKLKQGRQKIKGLEVSTNPPLKARAEHARWIIDCPNCNNAEFLFEDNLFFCSLCGNSDIDGKARQIKMPVERKQIETILGKRKIKNRHWFPGETIADLENENGKILSK
jgi:hypothetical protein